jgi:hypothetical protein
MNNYILISRTYSEITPESCEQGDFSETGFISEVEEVSFSQLVDLMRTHCSPSSSPDNYDTRTYYSTEFYTSDYRTGTEREESIHFHHDNTENAAKYWKYARLSANKKRKNSYLLQSNEVPENDTYVN